MIRTLYTVSDLKPEELRMAFPVMRIVDPNLTLDRWVAYAQAFLVPPGAEARSKIITVRSEQGTIHGLAFCRLRPDLRYGRELEVDDFIGLGFRGGKQASAALLQGVEALAKEWDCRHIRLSGFGTLEPAAVFRKAGYREEPRLLGKSVLAGV